MTAIPPRPTTPGPFDTTRGPVTHRLEKPFNFPQHAPGLNSISPEMSVHEKSRRSSLASIISVTSGAPLRNQENLSPSARARSELPASSRRSPRTKETEVCNTPQTSHIAPKSLTLAANREHCECEEEFETTWSHHLEVDGDAVIVDAERNLRRALSQADRPLTPAPSPGSRQDGPATHSGVEWKTPTQRIKLVTPESGLVPSLRDVGEQSSSRENVLARSLLAGLRHSVQLHRLSDSSSGLIHSMKTASFTNASFSVAPKSSRFARSTDSYLMRAGQNRYSIDSDQPLSNGSSDDAALRRGFKRQQIIDELITTEETYISDLKALVYLYSTLLASTSSISNKVKIAIERNVVSILHMHEELLMHFREARMRAAARRWADTEVPARLGHQRESHSQRSGGDMLSREVAVHHRVRSSVATVEVFDSHPRHSGSAEPIDVFEIISILKLASKDFHAYEEYCANFELVGPELRKHSPHIWPTYESGIESLARVIMTIDQRHVNDHRGLTVSDLLIKPIQRLTKYPLLLEQLLNSTPVSDAPSTHVKLETVLQDIRSMVQMVDLARENPYTKQQIQRRWLLQERLSFSKLNITAEQFRSLGSVELCGILHMAYQSNVGVSGCYVVCVLFDEHLLIALPAGAIGKFETMALIRLSDLRIEAPNDGKGLQCASTFFTWKVSFACEQRYYEIIFSACSKIEEERWLAGLRSEFSHASHYQSDIEDSITTRTIFNLKSVGMVFSSQKSLSRESSVQRAATVGGRSSISHVIIRNTYNAHECQQKRETIPFSTPINRSQSQMSTKRVPVLEPRRSERLRLESSISDIWTRERLPFPGMTGSRGGQILLASAGSLVRKLSLASIQAPFSKGRTSSLSTASKKSYEILNEAISTFEIRRPEHKVNHGIRSKPKDIPEVDDMRSVVERMISGSVPKTKGEISRSEPGNVGSRSKKLRKASVPSLGLDDPANVFYEASAQHRDPLGVIVGSMDFESPTVVEGAKRRKKRWSRHWPIEKLKEFGSEARGMFYSTSSGS